MNITHVLQALYTKGASIEECRKFEKDMKVHLRNHVIPVGEYVNIEAAGGWVCCAMTNNGLTTCKPMNS